MDYKLCITEHADELLDNLLQYLSNVLSNDLAALHLINEIEKIYDRLEDNPYQFPLSKDTYLAEKGYREAVVSQMDYVIVFMVNESIVNVMGIFHQLENYRRKLHP